MADEDELGAAKRRRPPTTIDAKATEIASEPVKSSESTDPNPGATEPPSASARASASAGKPGQSTVNDGIAAMRAAAKRVNGRVIVAGVIGAIVMLVAFIALWGIGVFRTRDDLAMALAPRLALVETQVRELAARPQPAGVEPRALADLAARVGAAEQAMRRLADIDARVAKAEGAIAAPRTAQVDQALTDRVAALEAAQKNIQAPAAPAVTPAALEALSARIAALEQAAKSAEQKIAVTAGADRAARLAFVAVALRAAVERGEPFAAELAAAKPLAPDAAALGALEPFAATGVPRPVTLARELSQLTMPMINAAGTAPRDTGFLDRLQQNAERLVRIRPISEAPGDDPTTVVSRADVKATHGDLAGAVAELARLPEAAREPAQDWIKKAQAQIAAVAAARSLAENAIGALGKAVP